MKHLTLMMLFAFAGIFSQINAQDRYLEVGEYPAKITSYVKTHFPDSKIVSVKQEKEIKKTEYEVKLSTMEELEFDKTHNIKSAESESGLPNSIIPQKIRDYIAQNYPNIKIEEWKKKRTKQEVELKNNLDLTFDLEGNFLKVDK